MTIVISQQHQEVCFNTGASPFLWAIISSTAFLLMTLNLVHGTFISQATEDAQACNSATLQFSEQCLLITTFSEGDLMSHGEMSKHVDISVQ
jgi:ATP/ADP translocase